MKKVLVFCQRKNTNIGGDKQQVILTNKKIEYKYFEKTGSSKQTQFEFLTECTDDSDSDDCADYRFTFDMEKVDTQEFVKNKKGNYDDIILNTCPFKYILSFQNIYGISELLKNRGTLYLMVVNGLYDNPENYLVRKFNEMLNSDTYSITKQLEYFFTKGINNLVYHKLGNTDINCELGFVKFVCDILKRYDYYNYRDIINIVPPYIIKFYILAAKYSIESNKGNVTLSIKALKLLQSN